MVIFPPLSLTRGTAPSSLSFDETRMVSLTVTIPPAEFKVTLPPAPPKR